MNPNILVLTPSHDSTASRLGFPISTFVPHGTDTEKTVVVRWGNGFQDAPIENYIFSEQEDFKHVLNKQKSIELNVNKPEALKVLSKVVNTPKIYFDKVPSRKTVVYRPTSHAKGSDFTLKKGPFKIPEGYYATQYIKNQKEFRIFVAGNRTMTCKREKGKKTDSDICRSNWAYRGFMRSPKTLHRMAIRAAKALNLDIGGFDVIKKGRKYYFLEFNTAITVEGKSRQFFQKGIKALAKKKFPNLYKTEKVKEIKKESKFLAFFKKMGLV